MRQALKDSWWKVPLYCAAAGWISYQIKIRLGPFLAMTRLSDGDSVTVALDQTRWMLLSAVLFLAVLLAGGLGFFRRMTRQELFASSTVLVVWNVASSLLNLPVRQRDSGLSSPLSGPAGGLAEHLLPAGLRRRTQPLAGRRRGLGLPLAVRPVRLLL